MKLSAINLNYSNNKNIIKTNNIAQKQTNSIEKQKLLMPTTAQYLAFCGGYSINLDETFKRLNSSEYPCDIEENVLQTILENNPQNKTLYDIHFEKYKGVLDCYSLEELKEKYPEFSDVVSAWDVEAQKGSFIDEYKNNELEAFANSEDLALQLIKLYWGQGFSLNGLSDYLAQNSQDGKGIQLNYVMDKLNIPLMNRKYAHVLKLSNKKYNEDFTSQMSIKLKEAKEAKKQLAQGEAVVIPRGPLSSAHKEHISQGLKKYYRENPEKIYEMSERQKEFYRQHPEEIENMSIVMDYAWNQTPEGKSVYKGLARFFRKMNKNVTLEELANPQNIIDRKVTGLELFWKKNAWAREQFSKAVKKGYQYLDEHKLSQIPIEERLGYKNIKGERVIFSLIPTQVRNEFNVWAIKHGYNPSQLVIARGVIYTNDFLTPQQEELKDKVEKISQKAVDEFFNSNPGLDDVVTSALLCALVEFIENLNDSSHKLFLPKSLRDDACKREVIYNLIKTKFNLNQLYRNIGTRHERKFVYNSNIDKTFLDEILKNILDIGCGLDCEDVVDCIQKTFDRHYSQLSQQVKK